MAIHFFIEDADPKLSDKNKLKKFITDKINEYVIVKKIELNYIFCSDDALLQRNIQFLNHDTLTDIITFDLSEKESDFIGEIYISVDRVKDNAQQFEVSYHHELHRVIFHGVLHLIGYGDKKPEEEIEMRKMENLFLSQYITDTESK